MTDQREPLGPERAGAYAARELAALVSGEPCLLPALPAPLEAPRGSRLYVLGDVAKGALSLGADGARLSASSCVLGAFDGVHVGHRALVASALAEARSAGVPCVVVTFDPDPAEVLLGTVKGSSLLPVPDRLATLASLGVDAMLAVPFTRDLAATDYEGFLTSWLIPLLGARSLHVGVNFRMGAGGRGTVGALEEAGRALGVSVWGHELVCEDGSTVSATRIRGLVRAGRVADAAALLGRAHVVRGVVVHGRGEGTSFGFPTANLSCDEIQCLPGEGVYAGLACVDGRVWPTAVNVGKPRSFGGEEGHAFLEPTLLGFSGNLYDKELSVCFLDWLREPRVFPSLEVLERTVLGNVEWVRRYVGAGELRLGGTALAAAGGQLPDAAPAARGSDAR